MEEKYHPEDVSRRYFLNEELFLLWLFFFLSWRVKHYYFLT
jgi:hypothetical protein